MRVSTVDLETAASTDRRARRRWGCRARSRPRALGVVGSSGPRVRVGDGDGVAEAGEPPGDLEHRRALTAGRGGEDDGGPGRTGRNNRGGGAAGCRVHAAAGTAGVVLDDEADASAPR